MSHWLPAGVRQLGQHCTGPATPGPWPCIQRLKLAAAAAQPSCTCRSPNARLTVYTQGGRQHQVPNSQLLYMPHPPTHHGVGDTSGGGGQQPDQEAVCLLLGLKRCLRCLACRPALHNNDHPQAWLSHCNMTRMQAWQARPSHIPLPLPLPPIALSATVTQQRTPAAIPACQPRHQQHCKAGRCGVAARALGGPMQQARRGTRAPCPHQRHSNQQAIQHRAVCLLAPTRAHRLQWSACMGHLQ